MEFTINVDKIDLNDAISHHYDEDGDRVPAGTLGDVIARQLVERFAKSDVYGDLVKRVQTIRDEEIRAALAPLLAGALAKPIHPTNQWGEKTGAETTLAEIIVAEARKWMNAKVDSYGGRDSATNLQKMIRDEVRAGFENEIKAMVTEARDAVSKQIATTVAVAVQSAVTEGMRAR
jgi:hypothetical protein